MNLESCFLAIIAICVSAEIAPIPCVNDATCQGIITKVGETGESRRIKRRVITGGKPNIPSFCEKKVNPEFDFSKDTSATNPVFLSECGCTVVVR